MESIGGSGLVSGTPSSLNFTANGTVFVNGTGQLSSDGTTLSFAANWIVPGGNGKASGSLTGSPEQTPSPSEKVDYTEGTIPAGFDMAPVSQAGVAPGQPIFETRSTDVVYQSPTIAPGIWTAKDAAGKFIELITEERAVSYLADVSKDQFDDLAPYFLAKAMVASGHFEGFNLTDAFTLSKNLLGGLSVTVDTIDAWSDTIGNLSNVYSYYTATGQWPTGVGAVGLDNWASELKKNSSSFLANMLSGATLGILTQQEAQKIVNIPVQGWELIIDGSIDAAGKSLGLSVQTTQSFKFNMFVNEDHSGTENIVRLSGGDSADLIVGGFGDDVIYAGLGNDAIVGGGGRDTAVFFSPHISNSLEKTLMAIFA